jgi:hypothetical protein
MKQAAPSFSFGQSIGAAVILSALMISPAYAQLKDGTPAERDLMVWATTSVGAFGNNEQVAFDVRLATPAAGRATTTRVVVSGLAGSPLGENSLILQNAGGTDLVLVPVLDAGPSTIRLKVYRPNSGQRLNPNGISVANTATNPSCDLFMTREAGQFRAVTRQTCTTSPNEILFSPNALWTRSNATAPFAKMIRARQFECYVDMPGSGGINGEVFKRFEGLTLDDQGGEAWFTTIEATPRQLGLRLRSVNWAMNNKPGTFTRNSLTLYLMERQSVGEPKLLTYAWTQPDVRRIGLNAQWALANCFMEANSLAKPEF